MSQEIDEICLEWINLEISDAKTQGRYTDLKYDSEVAGFSSVNEYLEHCYYEALNKRSN